MKSFLCLNLEKKVKPPILKNVSPMQNSKLFDKLFIKDYFFCRASKQCPNHPVQIKREQQ